MKILLTIAYDGTNYCGWQRQNDVISVQEKIEDSLLELFDEKLVIIGASRTDAHVHALGQRAIFTVPSLKIPVDKLPQVINRILPTDIVINMAEQVSDDFHPQHNAKEKTYIYKINNSRYANPLNRNQEWHIPYELNYNKMVEATKYFIGEHDFKAFCSTNGKAKTSIRTIYDLNIIKNEENLIITVRGNGFLYNMVRIIVGTLIYAGTGKVEPRDMQNIIKSGQRDLAGNTAPPQGLCLKEIFYNI